jgi:protease II
MDPEYVRTIHDKVLVDPLASLEDPSSREFKDAIARESASKDAFFRPYQATIRRKAAEVDKLLRAALPPTPAHAQEAFSWFGRTVYIQHGLGHRKNVWILAHNGTVEALYTDIKKFGVDSDTPHYFTIADSGSGYEFFELCVYTLGVQKPRWSKAPVGPNAVLANGRAYYELVENKLRSCGIVCVNLETGSAPHTIYTEKDKRFNLEISKPPRQQDVFVKTSNALSQRIGIVGTSGFQWISPRQPKNAQGSGTSVFPVSKSAYARNDALVIHGKHYLLPRNCYTIAAMLVNTDTIAIITTTRGNESLYLFDINKKTYKCIYSTEPLNEIRLMYNTIIPTFEMCLPDTPNMICELYGETLVRTRSAPEPLKLPYIYCGTGISKDGTHVPFHYVSHVRAPKRLMVVAYGAYGTSGSRAYPIRWLHLLKEGYGLLRVHPRGGREDGDAWYDGGRTAQRKQNTFDDTAAAIQRFQSQRGFTSARTAFYGRSAGGWLAAYIAQKYPHLVGAVCMEVPYLDVLRTTTNPALPLTILEYDEFGNPLERPEDYAALVKISPVDIVTCAPEAAPKIWVRTALHDVQVYPYETLKWSQKMRAHGWNVLVDIDKDGGHFAASSIVATQYAEDAVWLDHALGAPRRRVTLRNHKSMGAWRRRTSSRKHKTRHSTSPSAE